MMLELGLSTVYRLMAGIIAAVMVANLFRRSDWREQLFSTLVMIRLGRVYRGLMVDLKAVNKKLLRRSEKILLELSGRSREEVHDALHRAGGNVKTALLLLEGCDLGEAARMLDRSGGHLRTAKAMIETRRGAKTRS